VADQTIDRDWQSTPCANKDVRARLLEKSVGQRDAAQCVPLQLAGDSEGRKECDAEPCRDEPSEKVNRGRLHEWSSNEAIVSCHAANKLSHAMSEWKKGVGFAKRIGKANFGFAKKKVGGRDNRIQRLPGNGDRSHPRIDVRVVREPDIGVAVRKGSKHLIGSAEVNLKLDLGVELDKAFQSVLKKVGDEALATADSDSRLGNALQLRELLGKEILGLEHLLGVLRDQLARLG
jgi:hypothetical protein